MLNFGANVSQLETCKPFICGKKSHEKTASTQLQSS